MTEAAVHAESLPRSARGSFYRAVWRWHFYAGLFVIPIVILLAISGAAIAFDEEIERFWYGDLIAVPPCAAAPATAGAQEAAALAASPGARVEGASFLGSPGRASEWAIATADGGALTVFVDPCGARVTGSLDPDWRIVPFLWRVHGELLLGERGDWLVELAASWAFVLLITGLYLWIPRGRGVFGTLVPRLGRRGRVFWRDLHSVPAAWNALAVAFLILSGLPWASFWGGLLGSLGTVTTLAASTPNFHGYSVPRSEGVGEASAGAHHGAEALETPWSIRHAEPPRSTPEPGAASAGIDRILAAAAALGLAGPGLHVSHPSAPADPFRVGVTPDRVQGQRTIFFDRTSAALLADVPWSAYSPLGKAVEWGVGVHMGRQFGEVNQWLCLAVCVATMMTGVTGAVLWWKRRPAGSFGAPRVKDDHLPRVVLVAVAVSAVVFPLLGASIVAIAIVDYAAVRLRRRAVAA